MPIISIEFALFILAFLPIYWAFKSQVQIQNTLLIIASLTCLFILNWQFAVSVTFYSILISFIGNLMVAKPQHKKYFFWIGISISLGLLSFFKYTDFFQHFLLELAQQDEALDILMPLGLSYYVFQSIAYLHSLYKVEESDPALSMRWSEVLLHFSFFPTITSGPIIRTTAFKSIDGVQLGAVQQIRQAREIIFPALAISLILLGLIKKWWFAGSIADNVVDPIFENPFQYRFWDILAAIYGYTIQLFFDFSGYSDLVIGIAMLFGFQLPKNFSAPLQAVNIRDFWNRWHISLSTWIRDYIYFPLGGNRGSFFRTQCNLVLAMMLSGIWHGSGWNFLLWGLLHGIALAILNFGDRLCNSQRNTFSRQNLICKALSILFTFNFVCITFVIFKCSDLNEVKQIFSALIETTPQFSEFSYTAIAFLVLVGIGLLFYGQFIRLFNAFVNGLANCSPLFWVIPICLLLFFVVLFAPSGIPGFIYANF